MKVSALIFTYNHARFISNAVQSALMQQCDFEFEIIISEDRSTDGTREIVQEFAEQHPDRIRLILSEANVKNNTVVTRAIEAATGEYIAMLDGDDYWTSQNKLQKQSDFLDAHPECSMCFHNALVEHEHSDRPPWQWTPSTQKEFSTLEDIWMGNFVATCSTMFRRGLIPRIPEWYIDLFPITDWPLHILHAEQGAIGYINEVMGVYRYHSGGLYSALNEDRKLEETFEFYRKMNANLDFRHNRLVRNAVFKYYLGWAEEFVRRRDKARAVTCIRKCLTGRPVNRLQGWKRLAKTWLRTQSMR